MYCTQINIERIKVKKFITQKYYICILWTTIEIGVYYITGTIAQQLKNVPTPKFSECITRVHLKSQCRYWDINLDDCHGDLIVLIGSYGNISCNNSLRAKIIKKKIVWWMKDLKYNMNRYLAILKDFIFGNKILH